MYYDEGQTLTAYNVHPFRYHGASAVLAMNGTLTRFEEMRYDLLGHIRPPIARCIEGTTDSEWVYALLLSHLSDPTAPSSPDELEAATEAALRIVREVRGRHGIDMEAEMNVVVADGTTIVATRFNYDYGWYREEGSYYSKRRRYDFTSLWCTRGGEFAHQDGEWIMRDDERVRSVIVASEPVTKDSSSWLEVPEYAMLTASLRDGVVEITARELLV